MSRAVTTILALVLLILSIAAQADVFNMGGGLASLETVTIGDAGNADDDSAKPRGSVAYEYQMGKFEVTAAQYVEFLNAKAADDIHGLYNPDMSASPLDDTMVGCKIERHGDPGSYTYSVPSDWANRPVNYVSYWDACRFANWLHNGQGNGDAETGAYTLNGYNGSDGTRIQRNPGARWFVPSESEWYKAAYYKGNGMNSGYWDYPTRSNTAPGNQVLPTDPGNSANYHPGYLGYGIGSPYYRTNVGEFENSASTYGTFDQGGNVFEWTEELSGVSQRKLYGGSFGSTEYGLLRGWSANMDTTYDGREFGIRVAAVPEPSSLAVLAGGFIPLLCVRRRRA